MKIAVFAYNFPHRKTNDFLFNLLFHKYDVKLVIAADPVKIDLPPSYLRSKLRYLNNYHPRDICLRFDIPYVVSPHNSKKTIALLNDNQIELGIIAGARLLDQEVINAVSLGIINFHPGLLPKIRGLGALKKSIISGDPPGITAHLIDRRMDAGRIIIKKTIPVYSDDTLMDLSHRQHDTQLALLSETIDKLINNDIAEFPAIQNTLPHSPPTGKNEDDLVLKKFPKYIEKFCVK